MKPNFALDRRWLTPVILVSLSTLVLILIAFAQREGITGDYAQPTPCPDAVACHALKRYNTMRATTVPQP